MTANKPETALYRAPTFPLLASHGCHMVGISSCIIYTCWEDGVGQFGSTRSVMEMECLLSWFRPAQVE